MPLTRNNIRISYNKAIELAKSLSSAADKLGRCHKRGESALATLESSWEGEAARAHRSLLVARLENVQKLQNDINELADAIRSTADTYRRSQLEDYRQQQSRL